MTLKYVIPTLAATAACALGSCAAASAASSSDVDQASSENWSGYVVESNGATSETTDSQGSFKSVTGSWTQPTVDCSASTGSTYSAFWVGLGGSDGNDALEQDGTEANCSASGTASYYAWYELVPSAPVKVDLSVKPGDKMTATTTVNGDQVTETIVNRTTGQSFNKTLTMSNPDTSSAEWIAEAPSECAGSATSGCSTLSLSNFGKVTFTGASATSTSGHTGSISDSAWQAAAVTLDPSAGSQGFGGGQFSAETEGGSSSSGGATPTSLSSDGASFSVSYSADPGATSTSGSTGGNGYDSSGGYGSTGGYGYGYGSTGGYGSSGYGYGAGSSGDGYGYGSDPYGDGGYGYSTDPYGYGDSYSYSSGGDGVGYYGYYY